MEKALLYACLLVLCISALTDGLIVDSAEMCSVVRQINCISHYQAIGEETVCCTDGKTYRNKCFYVQAKCKNIHLQIVHQGQCQSTSPLIKILTGSTTTPHYHGHFNVSDTFCANPAPCPDTMDPLCGTDSMFYLNLCEFNKAKCKNSDLDYQTLSNCKEKRTTTKTVHK